MARYSIISDVSNYIVKLLKDNLSPEPMLSSQTIELVSPADNNADYTLGVFMYDIRDNPDFPQVNMISIDNNRRRRPAQSLMLYYMIFVNASAQVSIKSVDIQKILAKVQQVLYDNSEIEITKLQTGLETREPNIKIVSSKLLYDEKTKIWTALNKPCQLALYYTVSPVMLSSDVVVEDKRVKTIYYNYLDKSN
ncbi:MAG: DUF4255 domain-containing protein [Oscillospiraceae bacterium]|nr:DUF4255 domain-containing protein [Oscillospiraceae bacterium]